jgi:hypothetical protein
MRATDGTMRFALPGRGKGLISHLVRALSTLVLIIGSFLLARRVLGAFSSQLPSLELLITAVIVTTCVLVVRELSSRDRLDTALGLITLLMFALACSYPGERVVDWLVWPTAMFAVVLCPPLRRHVARQSGQRPEIRNGECKIERVLQEITRVRTEDGHESIRGLLVAELPAGERQATLYIAFCPPFERLPEVEVNLVDDIDATVKITHVLHNGAQLDVRLAGAAAEPINVTVELFASGSESPLAV